MSDRFENRLDEDFKEFDEALKELEEVTEELSEEAKEYDDAGAAFQARKIRKKVGSLRNSYDDIEDEIKLSREWIDEVRQAESHFFPKYLDTIDDVLQNIEDTTEKLANSKNNDYAVYEDRRGALKWLGLAAGVFGIAFAADELSDEYDVDWVWPLQDDGNSGEVVQVPNSAGNSVPNLEECDLIIEEEFDTDSRPIGNIGDRYRGYGGEIGHLGDRLRHQYSESVYEDLFLGYHDNRAHVQMRNSADNIMVDFQFDDRRLYEEAKNAAE